MSKSTLSALKYAISTENRAADEANENLKYLERSICNAMDDRVGIVARESLAEIMKHFSYSVGEALSCSERAVDRLGAEYDRLSGLAQQGDRLLSDADAIIAEVGEI